MATNIDFANSRITEYEFGVLYTEMPYVYFAWLSCSVAKVVQFICTMYTSLRATDAYRRFN